MNSCLPASAQVTRFLALFTQHLNLDQAQDNQEEAHAIGHSGRVQLQSERNRKVRRKEKEFRFRRR